jgi:hypothetical protein
MRDQLIKALEGLNPKAYARKIRSSAQLNVYIHTLQQEWGITNINETIWCVVNDVTPLLCKCGKKRQFNTFILGYRAYCANTCEYRRSDHGKKIKKVWSDQEKLQTMIAKKTKTMLDKYGVDNPIKNAAFRNKMHKTNMERYGAPTPFESNVVREKIKESCNKAYGVEFPLCSPTIQKKAKETFLAKYPESSKMEIPRQAYVTRHGVTPFANEAVKEKIKAAKKQKYGYVHALQKHLSKEVIEILESRPKFVAEVSGLTLAEAAEKLGVNPTTIARRALAYECRDIISVSNRSVWEYKLTTFLQSIGMQLGEDFIKSDRTILSGKELDFYFPKHKFAIEVGSVFWHSEINAGRTKYYHFNKWSKCKEAGIDLYQYFDYELLHSWEVIINKILYLLGRKKQTIGARKVTDIRPVELQAEREFLEQNHIQGFSGDRKYVFGAYIGESLVAVIALAIRPKGVEIVRYATDLKASYPGLFSKLLTYALKTLKLTNILVFSYSDNRHSNGNVYAATGFTKVKDSAPTYYYTKNYHEIENKKKFTKQKIEKKFEVEVQGRTEWQLMQSLDYDRIWDAGKIRWEKQFS